MRLLSIRLSYALLIFAAILLSRQAWSQVAIGTSGTNPTPNANAVLLLEGNGSQGLIIPVGDRNSVATPTKGMIIFDTNQVYFYNGSGWAAAGGGSGSSLININGNTITVGSGTTSINLAQGFSNSANGFLYWNGTAWQQAQFTLPASTQALVYNPITSSWGFQALGAAATGNLTTTTSGLTITGGTNAVNGIGGATINIQNASTTQNGLLTSTDFNTFNGKLGSSSTATGDLSGTFGSPVVAKIQGRAVFNQAPTNGQVLKWNSSLTQWEPGPDNVGSGVSVPLNSGEIMAGVSGINTAVTVGLDASLNSTNGNITVQGLRGRPISNAAVLNNSVYQYSTGTNQWEPVVLSGSLPALSANQLVSNNGSNVAINVGGDIDLSVSGLTGLFTIKNNTTTGANIINSINSNTNPGVFINGAQVNPDFVGQNISTTGKLTTGTAGAFAVNPAGNIIKINGATTSFPAANAAGVLTNDGAGTLTWNPSSGFSTNNVIPRGNGSGLVSSTIQDNGTTASIGTVPDPNKKLIVSNSTTGILHSIYGLNSQVGAGSSIGIGGEASGSTNTNFGVYGTAFGSGTGATGVFGSATGTTGINYGIYGTASGAPTNWAGYFLGNAAITGNLFLASGTAPSPTTDKLYNVGGSLFWNGTNISSGGSGWSFVGNPSRVDGAPGVGTNYIGTTDNVPLNFMVNNQRSGRIDPALFSTFFGFSSGQNNSSASNTGFGNFTLAANTSGAGNTAVGTSSLSSLTTGNNNTAVGNGALFNNVTGSSNAAFGNAALSNSTNASGNTAMGTGSLQFTTTGNGNTAMGQSTLSANSTGGANTAVGSRALSNNTASNNTAVGNDALFANTSAGDNAAFGVLSLAFNTAAQNTGLGAYSLQSNTTGADNAGVGNSVLLLNTTGSQNTAVGSLAGRTTTPANANTTGSANTFIGYASGPGVATQLSNATSIGANAKVNASNTIQLGDAAVTTVNVGTGTTAKLVAGGLQITGGTLAANRVLTSDATGNATWQLAGGSLINNTGTRNLFAGLTVPTTGTDNAIFGDLAGNSNTTGSFNVIMGTQAAQLKTTGDLNVIIGWYAGRAGTGTSPPAHQGNTLVGANSGEFTTAGSSINSFFGERSGYKNTTGAGNTFIGDRAGAVFPDAGTFGNTTGSNNTALGTFATMETGALTNATAVGYRAMVSQDNSLVLGSVSGVNGATANTSVGIGTTTPLNPLNVQATLTGTAITTTPVARFGNATLQGNTKIILGTDNVNFGAFSVVTVGANAQTSVLGLGVGNAVSTASQFNLDGLGHVGIGASPSGAVQLYVADGILAGSATFNPAIKGSVNSAGSCITATNTGFGYGFFGQATANGGNSVWTNASDLRLKKNIMPLSNALQNVLKMRGVTFDWRHDEFPNKPLSKRHDIGVIAQEIKEIYPEVVVTDPDGYLAVGYPSLVPVLIEAIKEQQQMINLLKTTDEESKKKIEKLEALIQDFKIENNKLSVDATSTNAKQEREIANLKKQMEEVMRIVGAEAKKK
jgi:trimeric autotransporter adhesin